VDAESHISAREQAEDARREAERELAEMNENLERRVLERTLELEAANKELEAFSYFASHDLRAPLRALDGFSLALLEDYGEQLDDTGKDYLARVHAAAQRMGQLIDDLLMLSRLTRREMVREKVDLSALARDVLVDLREAEPERAVDAAVADGLVANGDPALLRIVLQNLLANAWKFTSRKPEAHIEVGVDRRDGVAAYYVGDGAGFDATYVDKLFTPFQRLHAADEFPGTGSGLATVKRIVRRHGGSVWAEGAVDSGATFYFTLH
jgi:light-regulated signal transduction histidine kinase (bacteriophytochrome)